MEPRHRVDGTAVFTAFLGDVASQHGQQPFTQRAVETADLGGLPRTLFETLPGVLLDESLRLLGMVLEVPGQLNELRILLVLQPPAESWNG